MESVQKLSRNQVHEKLKRNFHALYRTCPVNGSSVANDDSLTNLQWLWNLNVNLSNPTSNGVFNVAGKVVDPKHESYPSVFPGDQMLQQKHRPTNSAPPTNAFHISSKQNSLNSASRKATLLKCIEYEVPTHGMTCSTDASMQEPASSYSMPALHGQALTTSTKQGLKAKLPIKVVGAEVMQGLCSRKEPLDGSKNFVNPKTASHLDQCTLPDMMQLPIQNGGMPSRPNTFSGQMNHKPNPYAKPAFSYTTLICMALNSAKRNHMTFPSICKWIKDNFIYYRYADSGWQNSVKLNLNQSKFFCKVEKKKDAVNKVAYWQIDSLYAAQLQEVSLHSCEKKFGREFSSSDAPLSLASTVKFDSAVSCVGRKRKQPSPQKVLRRRNLKKRCSMAVEPANRDDKNLLQEQAPELGSLKGDFNWNSIFDDFFGATEGALSITPTSLSSTTTASTPSNLDSGRSSISKVTSIHHTGSVSWSESKVNDENQDASLSCLIDQTVESPWSLLHDDLTPLCKPPSPPEHAAGQSSSADDFFIEGPGEPQDRKAKQTFFEDVCDIDLTITGKHISPPEGWTPVTADLSDILCEKHDENLFLPNAFSVNGECEMLGSLSSQPNAFSGFAPGEDESRDIQRSSAGIINASTFLL